VPQKDNSTIKLPLPTAMALLVLSMSGRRPGKSLSAGLLKEILKPRVFNVPRPVYVEDVVYVQSRNSYGCLGFIGDVFMTIISGGLWLIWIFVREMRRR
jgi:hypothetical protein